MVRAILIPGISTSVLRYKGMKMRKIATVIVDREMIWTEPSSSLNRMKSDCRGRCVFVYTSRGIVYGIVILGL